jgi:predicted DNA-binding transcriptional regulator YafY
MAGAMADVLPLVRQWTVLRMLSSGRHGQTVQELAHEMSVSQKTIRRDLLLLARVGFPLVETHGDHGRKSWRIAADRQPDLLFTFDELASLYLGRRLLEPLAGTVIWDAAQRAMRKIRSGLGDDALRYLEKLAALFHSTAIGASDYASRSEIIDQLMIAIEDRKIACITYRSMQSTEPITYDVYPYGLIYHRGSLYLVAFAPQHDEIRHYRIDRIDAVEIQTLQFTKPPNFDLKTHLNQSFGVFRRNGTPFRAKIRFSASVSRYIEEKHWHPSQRLTRERDGSLLLELTLTSLEELASWILSFGENAIVLEPQSLKEEVKRRLTEAASHYNEASKTERRSNGKRSKSN